MVYDEKCTYCTYIHTSIYIHIHTCMYIHVEHVQFESSEKVTFCWMIEIFFYKK